MNIKKLTPQEQEALDYITEVDGQGISGGELAEKLNLKRNHADTILLKLLHSGWLDRWHVEAGRHSHYKYLPAEDGKEA